jgi:hypothetical protein
MRFIKSSFVAALCIVGSSIGAQAQTWPDSLNLLGRTSLTFGLGLTGARTSDVTFSQVQTHTTGQLASLAFTHWVRPDVAVQISTGVLNADNRVSGTHVQDNAIIPILFGVTASPRELALSASVRPYVSLAAGPYIHAVDDVNVGSVNSLMETTAGAKAAVGANWCGVAADEQPFARISETRCCCRLTSTSAESAERARRDNSRSAAAASAAVTM